MTEHVRSESRGAATVVTIDRPPANALDVELVEELRRVFRELGEEAPGAVVLCGRERFFSSGFDLGAMLELDPSEESDLLAASSEMFAELYSFSRPIVCAVTGHAIAGGLILSLCGDYRVGAAKGRLGLTEALAGVPYPAVTTEILRAELPAPVLRKLAVRASLLEPRAAAELSLLDEVVVPEAVEARALEVAEEIAAMPRTTVARIKHQIRAPTIEAISRIVAERADPLLDGWLDDEGRIAAKAMLSRG